MAHGASVTRRLLASLLLLVLAGCQPPLKVRLASSQERLPSPRFEVSEEGQPRPRYTTVQVLRVEDRRAIWHLRAQPYGDDASVTGLTYGQVPDGFKEVVPAEPLRPGVRYAIVVTGKGRGELKFEAGAAGNVSSRPE